MRVNKKAIILRDGEALGLVEQRAINERRSKSNALATTVVEALGKIGDSNGTTESQEKSNVQE